MKQAGDWDLMVKIINDHGITALAAYNIMQAGLQNEVPQKALDFLKNGQLKSLTRNAWLKERWKEVNAILTGSGIRHVLLKGMALEYTIYGSHGLRQMTDNDILVSETSAERAWELLLNKGFATPPLKSPLFRKIMAQTGKHYPTLSRDDYMVDLHVRISGKTFHEDELDNITRKINIDGKDAYVLRDDIHLKFLVDHFNSHAINGDCQYRLYRDILLLDPSTTVTFPQEFVTEPKQGHKPQYRNAAYKSGIKSVHPGYRLRYLTGDIFPSITWMKYRYKCGVAGALVRYPARLLKLGRLI